jgi:cyclopropane fatty-acyl-phospholipid synthase-like methyltransferase
MFTKQEIAEYYNTTQIHYEKWWKLKNSLSLHYGIWERGIKTFAEALANTNRILMELSEISESDNILDAGCGVGGAAMYLASTKNVPVTGITLSKKQFDFATHQAMERGLDNKVSFHIMDYTQTSFRNESFDVVWACESISSAPDKSAFIKEAYRLLKKDGRLILSDFFLPGNNETDNNSWIKKWTESWCISELITSELFIEELKNQGFTIRETLDYSEKIYKSSKRLFYASLLGAIPSEFYNFFHPGVSRFSKKHYMSGYYQFKALKENLWKYNIVLAKK